MRAGSCTPGGLREQRLDILLNAANRDPAYRGLFQPPEYAGVDGFYSAHPELPPTPLRSLPGLARELSIRELLIKDETARFGVEAFKIAGVRFALARLGADRVRNGIVCATAGNHGRAVARAAREIGVPCTVFLPAPAADAANIELRTREARIAAMRADGARTLDVDGTYEDAVARAAAHAWTTGALVVSDTSWPGYDEIPRLIMLGYTRLFDEASRQWHHPPDIVFIQGGVGGLVCAAANWFAWRFGASRSFLIACEPASAACLLASARAGRPINIAADGPPSRLRRLRRASGLRTTDRGTVMAGLRCAEPSPAAWPSIQAGIDAFVAIPDAFALEAIDRLGRAVERDPAIAAGPSGACGIGALLALVRSAEAAALREACSLTRSTRVLAVITEGP